LTDYSQYQIDASPPWLQGPNGASWSFVSGVTKDAYLELAKRAVKARFPQFAPTDALDKVGQNFQIDRAFATNDTVFVAQLLKAWEAWGAAGTKPGMLSALNAAGVSNVTIWENFQWNEANPERWWRFWVVARPPYPWNCDPLANGLWSSSGTWSDGGGWATGIPQNDWARLRRIIRKWKPAHAQCVSVILLLNGELFGTRGGTWGSQTAWGGTAVYLDI
jgi:hypothetical protein